MNRYSFWEEAFEWPLEDVIKMHNLLQCLASILILKKFSPIPCGDQYQSEGNYKLSECFCDVAVLYRSSTEWCICIKFDYEICNCNILYLGLSIFGLRFSSRQNHWLVLGFWTVYYLSSNNHNFVISTFFVVCRNTNIYAIPWKNTFTPSVSSPLQAHHADH